MQRLNGDTKISENKKFQPISSIFEKDSEFMTFIDHIDSSREKVVFSPLSDLQSLRLLNFREMVLEISHLAVLKIALSLSVGMIYLSPTPWYSSTTIDILDKVGIFLGRSNRFEELVFISHLDAWREVRHLRNEGILDDLSYALIKLVLRGKSKEGLRNSNLITTELIALEMGIKYQEIVKVCLSHRYESSSGAETIEQSSLSFIKDVNEAIVVPLREICQNMESESSEKFSVKRERDFVNLSHNK